MMHGQPSIKSMTLFGTSTVVTVLN